MNRDQLKLGIAASAVNCSLQEFTSENAKVSLLGQSFVEGEMPVCLELLLVYGVFFTSRVPRDWSAN